MTSVAALAEPLAPQSAQFTDPTNRYPHNVLGDLRGFAALEVALAGATTLRLVQPEHRVFEDIAPRLWDVDGDGNRMIERLRRSLKYECVYLHGFETGSQARSGIGKWLAYYNAERPHSTHGILTPDEAYASKTEPMRMAA